jgi:heptaprenyl diphosphate synthase
VSILGAAAHNVGQILAAMVLMHSVYIGMYLSYLLLVALFTGFATGAACAGVLRILKTVNISKK